MQAMKILTAALAAALLTPAVQAADKYPDKPVRLIIGSAPGSGPDIISRLVSDRLYDAWNQRIVVDSRPRRVDCCDWWPQDRRRQTPTARPSTDRR